MHITPIKTHKITPHSDTLISLLDTYFPSIPEQSVVVIASKIVSLCEGRVVPGDTDREALIKQESDYYLPPEHSRYGHHFTVIRNTIIGSAGIDRSNGDGNLILWPADPQATANTVRAHLQKKHNLSDVGVLVVDSASTPLRLGAIGTALAFSGFIGTHSYVGEPDVFGEPLKLEKADVAGGLAAAAVLVMGEGGEQTPFALLTELPFLTFQRHDPTLKELATLHISLEEDLFEPFLTKAPWQRGDRISQTESQKDNRKPVGQ